MNNRDRKQLERVHGVLREIARLGPSNPMDISAHVRGLKKAAQAASELADGVFAMAAVGDWDDALMCIGEAEETMNMTDKGGRDAR